jgi:hypothetical protein
MMRGMLVTALVLGMILAPSLIVAAEKEAAKESTGLMEKMKDIMPGGEKKAATEATEKEPGMMEKIKDKLMPGKGEKKEEPGKKCGVMDKMKKIIPGKK